MPSNFCIFHFRVHFHQYGTKLVCVSIIFIKDIVQRKLQFPYSPHLPKELSCAQAARAAARRASILRSMFTSSLNPSRHVTRSMEGRESTVRSDNISMGAAAGMMGNTVKLQPQPLTEPSLVNFQRISSPVTRISCDQSDHSRPESQQGHRTAGCLKHLSHTTK